jgi:hypothetical protein
MIRGSIREKPFNYNLIIFKTDESEANCFFVQIEKTIEKKKKKAGGKNLVMD